MKPIHALAPLAALVAACAACSGGGGGGGAFPDSGGAGTGTLHVTAVISYDDGAVGVDVAVADASSTAVTGATVTLTMPTGTVTLGEAIPGLGVYSSTSGVLDWGEGFKLDIVHGGDAVHGVSAHAPTLTVQTAPLTGDTIAVGSDATVTWKGRGADTHRIQLLHNGYDSGDVAGDTGSDTIPAASINSSGAEAITILRAKSIPITGGIAGSTLTLTLDDTVQPIVVQ